MLLETATTPMSRATSPTKTPIIEIAISTLTSTPTPFPPLPPQGPYLLIKKIENSQVGYLILSADGKNRFTFSLPEGAWANPLSYSLSPGGKWLAYFTGSNLEPYDLTLNLLHIPDGSTRLVTPLFSIGFPENISSIAKKLPEVYPEYYSTDFDWTYYFLSDIINDIDRYAWSPDGRYLAFPAQIGGESLDLFVINVEANEIRRVTNDLLNISGIEWSPDGQWILVTDSYPGINLQEGSIVLAVKWSGSVAGEVRLLERGEGFRFLGWLSSNQYLVVRCCDGPTGNLFKVDIETGQSQSLGPADFMDQFLIDSERGQIVISSMVEPPLLQFIGFDGKQRLKVNKTIEALELRRGERSRYVGEVGAYIATVSEMGELKIINHRQEARISISPDYRWLTIYNSDGFDLYNEEDELIRTFSELTIRYIDWRPDSSGLYIYAANDGIYFIPVPQGEVQLIDQCSMSDCHYSGAVWLP